MLRTFSPPEQGEQPVRPAVPSVFRESSASRMNTRFAGRGRTPTLCVTSCGVPSVRKAAVTGTVVDATSAPGGEVSVQLASRVSPSRIDDAVAGSPSIDQPAGTFGASRTPSSMSSASSRSFAVTLIDCCPAPTHCSPCGSTVIVVLGTYDVGGSGPTAIRSRPGPGPPC